MPNSSPITIVSAADDKFAMPLAVTLYSALANHAGPEPLHFYVIDGGISKEKKRHMARILDARTTHLTWLPAPQDGSVYELTTTYYLSTAAYFRILIPDLLPDDVHKALYVDADVLVLEAIRDLWNHSLGEAPLAAVPDYYAQTVTHFISEDQPLAIPAYEERGLDPDTRCFNSGVMLMNLDVWRRESLAGQIIDYLRNLDASNIIADQTGLNAICAERWKKLDLRWNVQDAIFLRRDEFSSGPLGNLSAEKQHLLMNDPSILHFTGSQKPWHGHCRHPQKNLFARYLRKSGWFSTPRWLFWRMNLLRQHLQIRVREILHG